jgi:hypothetical protein
MQVRVLPEPLLRSGQILRIKKGMILLGKYQVFEISKNGKRIIKSELTIELAETLSQEMSKVNLENVYGYEPLYSKE